MKKLILFSAALILCVNLASGQEKKESKFLIGFNGVLPRGLMSGTALTNSMESIDKGYGLGVILQRKIGKNFVLFLDGNMYNYNKFLASQGKDVQSIWTVAESAMHWDEPGAPQIQYVHNLPTDVHFDMQTTGFRLGAKYIIGEKKLRPWFGAGFGYYQWTVNYFNEDKKQTYGTDSGSATGLTYLLGLDVEIMEGAIITLFGDFNSPIAKYSIEGLFYPQWDITDYDSPIMGHYRFGISLSFSAGKK